MKLDNKGFTLIEVLAVVVLLAIIAGIAINGVFSSINKGKQASYDLMISDIVIASQTLYEEIDFGNDIYEFERNGSISDKVSIADNKITTNLQTLVSNGYLSGVDNPCNEGGCVCENNGSCNKNKRILLNPKSSEDISDCRIVIEKNSSEYFVTNASSGVSICPDVYVKEVK